MFLQEKNIAHAIFILNYLIKCSIAEAAGISR